MFSIYIISKYKNTCKKIGLKKISLYDINNQLIPVIYSNNSKGKDLSSLFSNVGNQTEIFDSKNKTQTLFILEFQINFCLNFFVNNIISNTLHHIEIISYINTDQEITSPKEIKIYREDVLLFNGILKFNTKNIVTLDKSSNLYSLEKVEKNQKIISDYQKFNSESQKFISRNQKINSENQKMKENLKHNRNIYMEKNLYNKLDNNKKENNELFFITKNNSQNQFAKCQNIKIFFISNYGHKEYVGLTGIQFFDSRGKEINISNANTIGAMPKDLYTLYNDEKEKRLFENIFNGDNNTKDLDSMWVTTLNNNLYNNKIDSIFSHAYFEIEFPDIICLSKIKIYNYNDINNLDICAREIVLYFGKKFFGRVLLKQGVGEVIYGDIPLAENSQSQKNYQDFSQDISFPLEDVTINKNYLNAFFNKNFKTISDCYKTPLLPCGHIIKFQFNDNYIKQYHPEDYNNIYFKYKIIGLSNIEIYDEKGMNVLLKNDGYKIISNCEIFNEEGKDKILLNGTQNNFGNNCLFYIFDYPFFISYIKFYPLKGKHAQNSVKNCKIFCDNLILFEGEMDNFKTSLVYFISDIKTIKDLDKCKLVQNYKTRLSKEVKEDEYMSLSFE